MKTSDYYSHHAPDRKVGGEKADYMGGGLYAFRFNLPVRFEPAREGGWISPSNKFFPLRPNESEDFVLENDAGLRVPFGYPSAALFAYERGWILQQYEQAFGYTMDMRRNSNQQRRVTFTATVQTLRATLHRRRILAVADYFFDLFGLGNVSFSAIALTISKSTGGVGLEWAIVEKDMGNFTNPVFLDNKLRGLRLGQDTNTSPSDDPPNAPQQQTE